MFHYHQDNQYTRHEPAEFSTNIWVALDDMSPANGCLQVAPQTHLDGTFDSEESADGDGHRAMDIDASRFLPVRMHAGDAIAFSRLTVHGSGPNNTSNPRVAYALQYHREDVTFLDKETDSWEVLKESPRWSVGPVDTLGAAAS